METQWTNEDTEVLKIALAEKKPFSIISKETGRSIGSIAGKAYRLRGVTWTEEEDGTLTERYNRGDSFVDIAEHLPNRTIQALWRRARRLGLKRGLNGGEWTQEEDAKLERLAQQEGSYKGVALHFSERTPDACRKRMAKIGVRLAKMVRHRRSNKPASEQTARSKEKAAPSFRAPASPQAVNAIMAMDNDHCRYVWGDPDKANFGACMKALEEGEQTYCAEHKNIMTGANQSKSGGGISWSIKDNSSRPDRNAKTTRNGGFV